MKKEISPSHFLYGAWRAVRERFDVPETKSREHRYVAIRAAYCVEVRRTGLFSLYEIGASISFKNSNGGVDCLDHAAVLHLIRKAGWNTYNDVPYYHLALDFVRQYINENVSGVVKESIENMYNAYSENAIVNSIRAEAERLGEELKKSNRMADRVDRERRVLHERIRLARKEDIGVLIRQVSSLNSLALSLGYEPADIHRLETIESLLKTNVD